MADIEKEKEKLETGAVKKPKEEPQDRAPADFDEAFRRNEMRKEHRTPSQRLKDFASTFSKEDLKKIEDLTKKK